MKELDIKLDFWLDYELENYLLTYKGIIKVEIDDIRNEIHIVYDNNLIDFKTIKTKILLFLKSLNIPSFIAFDKHSKNKLIKYDIVIKDLCCEYCLKGMIQDLFDTDGIEKVYCNYDNIFHSKKEFIIEVYYDETIISNEDIKKLEIEFNS